MAGNYYSDHAYAYNIQSALLSFFTYSCFSILGTNLMDLPTEVLESGIFPYLTRKELKEIRLNKRLKDIVDSVIGKIDRKRNYKSYFLSFYC